MKWRYPLTMPTSRFDRSPGKVEPGEPWLTIGADPRYVDVLRRYPGHVRYPDTDGLLDTGDTSAALRGPTKVRPFVVAKAPGSSELVRGFVVHQSYSGSESLQVYYRYASDTAGKLRVAAPDDYLYQNAVLTGEVSGSGPTQAVFPAIGGPLYSGTIATTSDTEYPHTTSTSAAPVGVPVGAVTASTWIDGEYYIAGRIQQIGGQGSDLRLHSVWRLRKGAWERIGGTFNGDILVMIEFNGRLVVGGVFTTVSTAVGLSTARCLAQWPLESTSFSTAAWTELGGGVTSAVAGERVQSLCATTIGSSPVLLVGGYKFTEFGGTETCKAFAGWDDVAFTWDDYGSATELAATTIVETIQECEDGNDDEYFWIGISGAVGTAGITHKVTAFEPLGPSWTAPGTAGGGSPPGFTALRSVTLRHGTIAAGEVYIYCSRGPTNYWFGKVTGTVGASVVWTEYASGAGATIKECAQMVSGEPEVNYIFFAWQGGGATGPSAGDYVGYYDVGDDSFGSLDPASISSIVNSEEGLTELIAGGPTRRRGLTITISHEGGTTATYYLGGNFYQFSVNGTGLGLSGKTWDLAMRGHLLYILSSDGNHVVVSFDGAGDTLKVKQFGAGIVLPVTGATAGEGAMTTGYGLVGQYGLAYRYFDPVRFRVTPLSPAAAVGVTVLARHPFLRQTANNALVNSHVAPDPDYKFIEGFQSLSSLTITVPPGGTLYRAGYGSIQATPHQPLMRFMLNPDAGQAVTVHDRWWPTTDAFLAVDATRQWDPYREVVGEVKRVYATSHFEGVTFAIEERDGQLDLRWSPSWRLEPENFPYTNTYPLQVPVSDGSLCRFLAARDALILLAGSKAFRIDKDGTAIQVSTIYDGYSLLHTDAAVVVGNTVFAATQDGLLEINAQDGAVTPLPQLSRVFRRRWRGSLTPGSTESSVRLGYDERMKALYVLHPGLKELLVLSLENASMTLLPYCGAYSLFSCKDLDTGLVDRVYLLGETGWLAYPNAEEPSGQPRTMGGIRLNSAQVSSGFNFKPVTVTEAGTPVTTVQLDFMEFPFARDNESGSGVDLYVQQDAFIIPLTGTHAGTALTVNSYGDSHLTVNVPSGYATGDFTTDTVFAMDPIVFGVVGSNLWSRQEIPDAFYRRRVTGGGIAVAGLDSEGVIPAVPLLSAEYGLAEFGACLGNDAVESEPKTSSTAPVVPLRSRVQIRPGEALEVERSSLNWRYLLPDGIVDGNVVLPVVQSYVADCDLWIHELMVEGFLDLQVTSGSRE